MPISIVCTSCKTRLKVKDELEGKSIKCPKCGTGLEVSVPEMAPEEVADETEAAAEEEAVREAKPAEGKPAKKPKTDKKAKSEKKAAAEKEETDDEESGDETEKDEEKPRKKKKKKKKAKPALSRPVLLGIGGLVLVSVAALVYFLFLKGDTPTPVQAKANVTPAPMVAEKKEKSPETEKKEEKKAAPEKKEEKKADKKEEPKATPKKDEKKELAKKDEKKEPPKETRNLKAIWDKTAHAQPIAQLEKILGEKGKPSSNVELAKIVYGKEGFAERNPLTRLAAGVPNPIFHVWHVGDNALVVVVTGKEHEKVHRAIYLERRPEGVMKHLLDESSARKLELDKF